MSDSHSAAHPHHHEPHFLRRYIFSEDHKVIGIQFLFTGLLMLLLGGFLAMMVRIQLGWPQMEIPILGRLWYGGSAGNVMPPSAYNMYFSMHATVMIFFVIIPLLTGAFGNFTIPLMIGAPDMAFPKLNMASYWFMWPALFFVLLTFTFPGGAAGAGWTGYPTLSSVTMPAEGGFESPAAPNSVLGQSFWLLALIFVGISSMAGSVNYITTIVNMRAPGMTFFRLPMTIWAMFITAILQAMAL